MAMALAMALALAMAMAMALALAMALAMAMALAKNKMIPITIRKPVFYNRSISIRKDLIQLAQKNQENLQVKIEAKPYNSFLYFIDPNKVLSIGKSWFVKGTELVNFPISEMEIIKGGVKCCIG